MPTINEMSLSDVKKGLMARFDSSQLMHREDYNERAYFPKEVYYERIDSVLSPSNYEFHVTHFPVLQAVKSKYAYACSVELLVFDDDGGKVRQLCRIGIGYTDVVIRGKDGSVKSIEDPIRVCITDAKKDAIRNLIGANAYACNYLEDEFEEVLDGDFAIKFTSNFKKEKGMLKATAITEEDLAIEVILWSNRENLFKPNVLNWIKSNEVKGRVVVIHGDMKPHAKAVQLHMKKIGRKTKKEAKN